MTPAWVLPAVILVTLAVSLSTQIINYKLTDQEYIKSRKKRMKELQKSITASNSTKEIEKFQKELLEINNELMKHTMKPTLYTSLPLLLVFWGLNALFKPYGDLIKLPFALPFFGTGISWLGTYVIFGFIFSLSFKPLINKIGEKYGKSKK